MPRIPSPSSKRGRRMVGAGIRSPAPLTSPLSRRGFKSPKSSHSSVYPELGEGGDHSLSCHCFPTRNRLLSVLPKRHRRTPPSIGSHQSTAGAIGEASGEYISLSLSPFPLLRSHPLSLLVFPLFVTDVHSRSSEVLSSTTRKSR